MNTIIKNIISLSFIFLVSCNSENQLKSESFLSKQEMLEDFDLFKEIYQKANAGLYKYRTEEEIDSVFKINRQAIKNNISYRNFYNILWNVIDYTGSCHNQLTYPDSLDESLCKQKIFFPIPLKLLENRIYTNIEFENIPHGSEVISINAFNANQLITSILHYESIDGINKMGKCTNIETDWLPFYLYLVMGKQNQFEIAFKTDRSESLQKSIISSINYDDFYVNFKKRFSKTFENKINQDYSFTFLDSVNTGLLGAHTFAIGGPETEGHQEYSSFLDSVFSKLQAQKVENLIVDIRGNGGGNDPNDLLLYSYLTQREFRENTSANTLFQEIPFQEYYIYDDVEELTSELKEEHSILKDGKYYQNEEFNKVWEPKKNAFNGKTVLLIDRYVASAGSMFASMVKSDENAIVIGEETTGGYYGHTGHIPITYELPNSKLQLTFSIVDLEQDVKKLSDQEIGDGVIPHYYVTQSYKDFINHKDTQLAFAIGKIQNRESHIIIEK